MQFQIRTYDDDRTCRVVHTLTEQVLTETSLLALQAIRERLERAIAFGLNSAGFAAVIEQAVHRFLKHTLFVAQDDLRRLDLHQSLQAVVTDDDTAVQVIQIRRCESATIKWNQWTQFWRNDRNDLHDHPLRLVCDARVGITEALHHLQSLQRLALALLRSLGVGRVTQVVRQLIQIEVGEHVVQRLRPHFGDEFVRILVVQVLVFLREGLEDVEVFFFGQEIIHRKLAVLRSFGNARLNDYVSLVVDDLIQLLGREPQEVTNLVGEALEVPDVGNGHHQLDVAHALTTHFLFSNLYPASVAYDALVANALVLSAMAFEILYRTEDALAEQAIALGLVRPVVDGLRFQHFTVRLLENHLGRRQ